MRGPASACRVSERGRHSVFVFIVVDEQLKLHCRLRLRTQRSPEFAVSPHGAPREFLREPMCNRQRRALGREITNRLGGWWLPGGRGGPAPPEAAGEEGGAGSRLCCQTQKPVFPPFLSRGQFLQDIACVLPYHPETRWLITKMPDPQPSKCHILSSFWVTFLEERLRFNEVTLIKTCLYFRSFCATISSSFLKPFLIEAAAAA
ncbi:hypothetical protein HJG60_009410 [Phyllostomus discolor]|uniref:Uncharacterized protein n=1 Tax=Phyllostomus discolor TaxID=89673 RepID=A0A833YGF2_9CHIR|nr:hypothetical protein HJG60_009410 [Phyllostomus discolor]